MRGLKTVFLAAALCALFASSALAASNLTGVYGALKAGAGAGVTDDLKVSTSDMDTTLNAHDETDTNFMAGAAVGYDFFESFDVPVRTELEYMWRGESSFSYKTTFAGDAEKLESDVTAQTVFANVFVDWHNDSRFTPYLQAGLGAAFMSSDAKALENGVKYATVTGDNDTNLAWNVGAGVAFDLTESLALDASYRYVGLGETRFSEDGVTGKADIYSHDLLFGLRYTF